MNIVEIDLTAEANNWNCSQMVIIDVIQAAEKLKETRVQWSSSSSVVQMSKTYHAQKT